MTIRLLIKTGVCLFFFANTTHAALPPEAQQAFDQGVTASDKGRYLEAIASFQSAREKAQRKTIFDAPEIYLKLGETEAKVPGRDLRAVCWLAAYLSVVPAAEDAQNIKGRMTSLMRVSRERLWHLMQMTEDAGRKVAATERARGNTESSLDTVVALWSQCGGYEEAKKVASVIGEPYKRAGSYNRVTNAQIESGDFAGAKLTLIDQEKAAEMDDDAFWRGRARLDIATAKVCLAKEQAKAGDIAAAHATIAEAQQKYELLVSGHDWSQVNGAVAVAQAMAGDIKGAQVTDEILKREDARANIRTEARVAIAVAQIKAGNLAGAREALVAAQQTADETPLFDQGRRNIDLTATIAELDHAGSARLNKFYYELGLAQAHAGDLEGARSTAKLMDLEARKSLNSEFIRKEGVALIASDQLPVLSWLQKIEGTGWEMDNGLQGPIFTDYFHCTSELSTKGGSVDQTFSGFDRAVTEMRIKYMGISERLKEQFGL